MVGRPCFNLSTHLRENTPLLEEIGKRRELVKPHHARSKFYDFFNCETLSVRMLKFRIFDAPFLISSLSFVLHRKHRAVELDFSGLLSILLFGLQRVLREIINSQLD